jgi:hypothetical protein
MEICKMIYFFYCSGYRPLGWFLRLHIPPAYCSLVSANHMIRPSGCHSGDNEEGRISVLRIVGRHEMLGKIVGRDDPARRRVDFPDMNTALPSHRALQR